MNKQERIGISKGNSSIDYFIKTKYNAENFKFFETLFRFKNSCENFLGYRILL